MTYIIENEDNLLGLHHDTLLIIITIELPMYTICFAVYHTTNNELNNLFANLDNLKIVCNQIWRIDEEYCLVSLEYLINSFPI